MSVEVKFLYNNCFEMKRNFTKGSDYAVGFDLCSNEDLVVKRNSSKAVGTGVCVKLPNWSYGRIAPRSGLALRNYIGVGGGVIDIDYTGEIKVIIFNHSDEDYVISRGDRIAQFIVEKCFYPNVIVVDEIESTLRGENGFGSSGL